ncbi:hypothetical protein DK37_23230 [Halomonas sp. SUBG004]|nr:hypothetical protein DK37_23230 [Halomonas sp. SUBG004]
MGDHRKGKKKNVGKGVVKKIAVKNGDTYWVHTTVAPLLDGQRVAGFTAIRRKAGQKSHCPRRQGV